MNTFKYSSDEVFGKKLYVAWTQVIFHLKVTSILKVNSFVTTCKKEGTVQYLNNAG